MQICISPPDPADELCSLVGRSIHRIVHYRQGSNLCEPSACRSRRSSSKINVWSVSPFLYLQGNNMHRLRMKNINDESEFSWWTRGAIDQPRSRNELGHADLHRLLAMRRAHSISLDPLSFDPWPLVRLPPCELSPPGINSSWTRASGLLARALRAMEVGCSLVETADLRRHGPLTEDDVGDLYWNHIWWGERQIGT